MFGPEVSLGALDSAKKRSLFLFRPASTVKISLSEIDLCAEEWNTLYRFGCCSDDIFDYTKTKRTSNCSFLLTF
uniref:Uncharacterized protein n=1 Tax=Lepeophtheirus salmonis TaxID=72036 RepID=A0A0K2URH8_LEPSM